MSRVHLVSTQATEQSCPYCRRATLVAVDDGMPARVDPQPLDQTGELAALLDGRWTYTLTSQRELIHRDATQIRGDPLPGTIHAQHKCDPRPKQEGLF